jgi:pimeloyl-ACP methyl ester carboxylesterase
MPRLWANGIDLFYEIQGTGPPVLLIAGFACDHTIWSPVASRVSRQYRVIVFDNRGVGQTSFPDASTSIRQMANDATGLLDALDLGPVHVAGHSMGGMVAQELALAHPTRVQSCTLVSSCARLDARGKAIIESWGDLPRLVDTVTATRLILPWIYTGAFFERPGAVQQLLELIVANPYPPTAEAVYAQSRATSAHDTSGRLNAISCPVQVVVGREDVLLPVAYSEELVRGIPGAGLLILEQTGHGLLIESPDAVASALLGFLSRQSTH